jgi:4'-phosphopantetheinyl transferase
MWCVFYEALQDRPLLDAYEHLLDSEEQLRHRRFINERSRHQFLVSHALVRTTLSHFAPIQPQDWGFSTTEYGRPEVSAPTMPAAPRLRFNLSHTDGLIICAIVSEQDLGVDVEDVRRRTQFREIAHRFFSAAEVEALLSLPPAQQRMRFFQLWTLKEAYIKAQGIGLSLPLSQFSFHLQGEGPPYKILWKTAESEPSDVWQFILLRPSSTHTAAIAIRTPQEQQLRLHIREAIPLVGEWPMHRTVPLGASGSAAVLGW